MQNIMQYLPGFQKDKVITPSDLMKEIQADDQGKHDTIVKIGDINFDCEPWVGDEVTELHKNQIVNVRMSFDGLMRGGDDLPNVLDFDHFGGWKALQGLVNQMAPGSGYSPRTLTSVPVNLSMANFEYWKTQNANRDVLIRWREPGTGRLTHITQGRFPYARAILPASYAQLDNHDLMRIVGPHLEDSGMVILDYFIDDYRFGVSAVKAEALFNLKEGDEVMSLGMYISNSETGNADITIDHLAIRLICSNGMVGLTEDARLLRVQHKVDQIAEFQNLTERAFEKMSKLDNEAIEVYNTCKEHEVENLNKELVDLFQLSRLPNKYLKLTSTVLDKDYPGGKDGEGTRWNVVNALTKASQYIDNHDDSTLMQQVAGAYARSGFRSVASAKALNLAEAIS